MSEDNKKSRIATKAKEVIRVPRDKNTPAPTLDRPKKEGEKKEEMKKTFRDRAHFEEELTKSLLGMNRHLTREEFEEKLAKSNEEMKNILSKLI